jgi:hypothetical protein
MKVYLTWSTSSGPTLVVKLEKDLFVMIKEVLPRESSPTRVHDSLNDYNLDVEENYEVVTRPNISMRALGDDDYGEKILEKNRNAFHRNTIKAALRT